MRTLKKKIRQLSVLSTAAVVCLLAAGVSTDLHTKAETCANVVAQQSYNEATAKNVTYSLTSDTVTFDTISFKGNPYGKVTRNVTTECK
jgi:hypothetical protein